jgi:glycerol-3-phosphate cytidylyltransferase
MNNSYVFIRHGQTYWNKNGIMHGQYDIPLNFTGEKQAIDAAEKIKDIHFDLCYCSPLKRARSTAARLLRNKKIKIYYDDRLMELDKGLLEGKHINSEKILKDERAYILSKFKVESKSDFFLRVKSFVNSVEREHKDKTILIVAHSGTIKMLFFVFHPPNKQIHKAYYDLHIKNCKPYTLNDIPKKERAKKMKIGFFPMVADILHTGHVLALEEAKKNCDFLIVGLNCATINKDPQQSIYERFMQLRAVKWVDEVIPYTNAERDKDMFLSLDYDIYFLGEDYKNTDWEMKENIEKLEKEIFFLKRNHGYSSTRIKQNAQ